MKSFLRQSAILALCLFFIAVAQAQQSQMPSLQGLIQNEAGSPVAGAEIDIPDLHLTVLSDSAGAFSFRILPRGTYSVQVRTLGYHSLLTTISIPQTAVLHLTLKDAVVENQEVVITGSGSATDKRRSTLAIASIRQAELLQNGSTNIVDALTRVPGVSQISTGPAISKPVIRGLGYNRTVVMADGIRQEGQQWGDEHGLEADDYQVERIEVLKGPASLAYGSDALAGVVNILTENPIPQGQMRGQVLMNYQTNSNLRALHGRLGGNTHSGFSWSGWATGKEAQDYRNRYDGRVFNSRFQNLNFGGALGIAGSKGSSRIVFSQFTQHLGLVEGDRDSTTGRFLQQVNTGGAAEETLAASNDKSYTPNTPSQRIRHRKMVWSNNLFLRNGNRLSLTLGGQENLRREYGDVLAPETPALSLQLRTATYDLRYTLAEKHGWSLTLGSGGMAQQNQNLGSEFLIPDYALQEGGVYALARHQQGRWLWSGGGRFDTRTLRADGLTESGFQRFTPFSRSFNNFSGSLGASYTPSEKLTVRANAATGYRAPNIAELAANGVHEGTFRYEYGNRNLQAERSFQIDLGATVSSEHVLLDVALFYNHIANYIYLQKLFSVSGADSIPAQQNPDGYSAYQFAQQSAALLGGELFLDLHPHPTHWLHFQNTFAYVAGRFSNTNADSMRYLPLMPPFRWTSELRADRARMGRFFRNSYVKMGVEYNAAQARIFSAYGTETTTPAYWLFSAGAGMSFTSRTGARRCDLILSAQNLTDAAWQNHLSRLKYAPVNNATGRGGVWGAGRNFFLTLVVPLSFVGKQS